MNVEITKLKDDYNKIKIFELQEHMQKIIKQKKVLKKLMKLKYLFLKKLLILFI